MTQIKSLLNHIKWTKHQILNGRMYVLVSGCQWRMLPKDMPPWETVYYYFNVWKKAGVMNLVLKKSGKKALPFAGKRTLST